MWRLSCTGKEEKVLGGDGREEVKGKGTGDLSGEWTSVVRMTTAAGRRKHEGK